MNYVEIQLCLLSVEIPCCRHAETSYGLGLNVDRFRADLSWVLSNKLWEGLPVSSYTGIVPVEPLRPTFWCSDWNKKHRNRRLTHVRTRQCNLSKQKVRRSYGFGWKRRRVPLNGVWQKQSALDLSVRSERRKGFSILSKPLNKSLTWVHCEDGEEEASSCVRSERDKRKKKSYCTNICFISL